MSRNCNHWARLEYLFWDDLGYDVATAKAKCAEGCDARDDCKFANVHINVGRNKRKQGCDLFDDTCGTRKKWSKVYTKETYMYVKV